MTAVTAADPVNTENGDLSESSTDLSVPTFGPGLDFTRTYDAGLARLQAIAGTAVPAAPAGPSGNGNGTAPGSMGFGWTSNWDTWAGTGQPMPGDLYTVSGLGTDNGNGGPPAGVPLSSPGPVFFRGGSVYLADTAGNRVLEVAGSTGTQWGIPMTQGDIYQIAGSPLGIAGSSDDGTAISKSRLSAPAGLALDSAGNLYIADTGNDRVAEIPASPGTQWGMPMTANKIYNVAGHPGSPGHSGDGTKGGFLDTPAGVAFDGSGDLYIADAGNNRVQEVFTAGGQQWGQPMTPDYNYIYTVAGSASGSSGAPSADGTLAAGALLNFPEGVSVNGAGMFVADTGNNRVIEVPIANGPQWGIPGMQANHLYTVAGSATGVAGSSGDGHAAAGALLNQPVQVGSDNGRQLYIADTGNNKIREVAWTSHSEWNVSMTLNDIYTIAGTGTAGFSGDGGPALSARLNGSQGFALDGTGVLYIADTNNNRLRRVSGSTFGITGLAGNGGSLLSTGDNGPALDSAYFGPAGVACDKLGNLYIADEYNNRVQEIAAATHTQFGIQMTAGDVYTIAGNANGSPGTSGDGGNAAKALLNSPLAVAVDPAGDVFIADAGNNRVQEVTPAGTISTVAGSATGVSGFSGDGGPAISALLDDPVSVAVDPSGTLYIADLANNRVQEVTPGGTMKTIAGSAAGTPGTSGNGGPAASALLNSPAGVTAGPAGDLYIADAGNSRVQEIYAAHGNSWGQAMTAGDIYTIAGSATGNSGTSGDGGPATAALLDYPAGLALDSSGDLYVADTYNNRVQEIPAVSGTQWGQSMTAAAIYTIAGSPAGTLGQSGTGRPAAAALLNGPADLAVDPAGNLVIPDDTNNLIDEVTASPGSALYPVSPAGTGITITQPGQSQITFYPKTNGACPPGYAPAGTGGYCAPPQDTTATLTTGNGTYTYAPSPGTSYTYSSSGSLASETGTAGDTLTATYGTPAPGTGNCPPAASWCQAITSASGRALTIGYNSASLITSVTDPVGRRWAYAYNSASQLTTATDPLGNITSYTYGQGSTANPSLAGDLLTITRPSAQPGGPDAGHATVSTYDSQGRVTSQTDPMGNTTSFSYCVNAVAGNCLSTAAGGGAVTVTDPQGNQAKYTYTSGALTATATWNGTIRGSGATLATTSYTTPDQAGGTQLSTASVDGNGNLTTATYDQYGNPVTTTAPTPAGTQATTTQHFATSSYATLDAADCTSTAIAATTCQASPGPNPVAPGSAITPPPAAPPQGLTWTLYDTNGNQLYTTTGVYQPGSNTASYSQTTYQLFKGNSVTLNGHNITCTAAPPSPSLPCATINADGVVTQVAYNAQGDLTSTSVPDGNPNNETATTSYGYDGDGEQTSVVSPDGNLTGANAGNYTTITAYNNDGLKTSVTQGDGTGHTVTPRQTQYGYDADGNQTTVEDARGYTTTTTYNAGDQATLVTDPDGNATLTCYDSAGNTAQTVPPVGVAANNLTPASCPTSYPAGYGTRLASDATVDTFDAAGNLTQETTPAPAGQSGHETTSYTYDGDGNTLTTTAPPASNGGPNQVTADTYNPAGELATETTGSGTSAASTVSYCYDPNGDTTSAVYGDGNASGAAACETSSPWAVSATSYPTQASFQTTSSYDSAAELVSTTTPATSAAPNGATTSATYDTAGNKLTSTDPNGVTTTWTYTPLNEPAKVSYSGSSAHSVSYGYDAGGSRTSMTDATGSSSYLYDPFGELTSATNGTGQVTGYGYNADGTVSAVTYPLPSAATWATTSTANYTYDNASLPTKVTDFNGNAITIGNTANGLPSSAGLGSTGDTITTTYDGTDNQSAISLKNSSTTLQTFSYTDSPAGTTLSECDTSTGCSQPTAAYTYDAAGRVTSMTPHGGTQLNYGFDASGNLSTLPNGSSTAYDNAGELTSSVLSGVTTTYSYNADGQRLKAAQGGTTLTSATWNGAGQLASYDDASANMTAAYDGNGLRATATTATSTQNFTWDATGDTPQLLMDSSNAYIYAGGSAPTEQVNLATGAITYLVADSLGSVRGTVNSSGSLTATTSYDAWGNPETAAGLTASTPFGYAGGYTDSTGLIYLINRYYDPATGQFTSVDPYLDQTLQPYSYANADPVDQADPNGLYAITYRPRCGKHVCLNITKRCGSDNKCGLYWGFKLTGSYRNAKHVSYLLSLAIEGTKILPSACGCVHHPTGNYLGTHVWYGQWGFHIKGHDWGYYCIGPFNCTHMGPGDQISLGASGTLRLNGVKIHWGNLGSWQYGKHRPWKSSYNHPVL